ncbi:MAG: GNAT family N-acetyltransferase [Candidatus Lokiarchaeota archaeon]|nr:GNAT family N-acetyltransferase [Candidatus Lokiarchaeota archaeon]
MTLITDLYQLQKKDLEKAIDVFVNAYSDDPMFEKFIKEEDKRRAQFKIMTKFCMKYGNVYSSSDNIEGVMAIVSHDKGDMTGLKVFLSGGFFLGLKLLSLQKIMGQSAKAIEEAKKDLDLGPYIFLFIMAVSKENQGKGFGGKFLRAIIEKSEIERLPIYLETQNEKNVSLYEKFGFHVVKKINMPDPVNLPMWLMVRDAK